MRIFYSSRGRGDVEEWELVIFIFQHLGFLFVFLENLSISAAAKEKLCLLNTGVRFGVLFFLILTPREGPPFPERSAELKLPLTPTDFCAYAMCKDIIICFVLGFFDQKICPQRFVSYSYVVGFFFFNRF